MRPIYHLENDFPLILTELLLNILQWHEFPQVKSPSDKEMEQAVNVWRNLDQEFHDDQLKLCELYAGFPNEMTIMEMGLLCRGRFDTHQPASHLSLSHAR